MFWPGVLLRSTGVLGADPNRIGESQYGEFARKLGVDPTRSLDGMGVSFVAENAGKRSIGIDL